MTDAQIHDARGDGPPIPCPACLTSAPPAATVGPLVVCAGCGASLVVDGTGIRRATGADTLVLGPADLQILRTTRGRIARAAVR